MRSGRSVIITCSAPPGEGGLGSRCADVIRDLRQGGAEIQLWTTATPNRMNGLALPTWRTRFLCTWTPIRFSPGWRQHLTFDIFDRAVARRIERKVDEVIAFAGQALHTFRRARRLGCRRLVLISATAHIDHVEQQHRAAYRQYPIEKSWLNEAQRCKVLHEYALADEIRVASRYVWDSFVRAGVAQAKLRREALAVDPRFVPAPSRSDDGPLRIVYTGVLSVVKGVPLLIDALGRLRDEYLHVTLVGNSGTRGMRQFLRAALARDPRIDIAPGDPLPHLHRASVYVHPSYQDGWGRAADEALACGVPVIVSQDTGMKELAERGADVTIVPTGNLDALVAALRNFRSSRSPSFRNLLQEAAP